MAQSEDAGWHVLFDMVCETIEELMEIDDNTGIFPESRLREDINMSDRDIMKLALELESLVESPYFIDEVSLLEAQTVSDVVDFWHSNG